MRKKIGIILLVLALAGTAMAVNGGVFSGKRAANNTRNTQVAQPQAENLIDIATAEATEAPVVTPAPAATPVVTAEPTATPVVTAEPTAQAINHAEAWFEGVKDPDTQGLRGIYNDAGYTRVTGEITRNNFWVSFAGTKVAVVVDDQPTEVEQADVVDEDYFKVCNTCGGLCSFTQQYEGEQVKLPMSDELMWKIDQVARMRELDNGTFEYRVHLCEGHGSRTTVTTSTTDNGDNGGNGGDVEPSKPTPSPEPSPAPLAPVQTEVPVTGNDDLIDGDADDVTNEGEYSDTKEEDVPAAEDVINTNGGNVGNIGTYTDEDRTTSSSSTTTTVVTDNGGEQETAQEPASQQETAQEAASQQQTAQEPASQQQAAQEPASQQQAAPLMAAPLMEVEEAPAQEQTVQVEDDPIVVTTESVQEAPVQDMAPLMPAPLAPVE